MMHFTSPPLPPFLYLYSRDLQPAQWMAMVRISFLAIKQILHPEKNRPLTDHQDEAPADRL